MASDDLDREAMRSQISNPLEGKKVLVTRARDEGRAFADGLSALGAEAIMVSPVVGSQPLQGQIDSPPDFITLTSSSAAKATIEGLQEQEWLRETPLVCIGPVTAATVREMGYDVAATADAYTTDGMIKALVSLAVDDVDEE